MSPLTLIVAATKTNGIGKHSRLPWRLPLEMAYFARVTTEAPEGRINAVIMGRNTWESIPTKFRPLKKRVNIVISRNPDYALQPAGSVTSDTPAYRHSDLESALKRLSNPQFTEKPFTEKPVYRQFVIGGASLYCDALALPLSSEHSTAFVDRVLITRILSPDFTDCDVFMPNFLSETVVKDGKKVEWRRATHDDLQAWVGFDVPRGVQKEDGVEYEFQMWLR